MLDIIKLENFKSQGVHKKKRQIILCHTSREVKEYLTSLQFRLNGKYQKIPHYLISKNGEIYQLQQNNKFSNFFEDEKLNQNSIVVMLENLGWLERIPLSSDYINWKGSIYRGDVFEKKWRDYFFWDPYTKKQIDVLGELCNKICEESEIPKVCSNHNTKIEGIKNFEGIISKSNLDSRYTDLNPSFDFEQFLKKLEHEQLS